MVDTYLNMEKDFIEKNIIDKKEKMAKNEDNNLNSFYKAEQNNRVINSIPDYLRFIELITIILYIIFSNLYIGSWDINQTSNFNNVILNVFDETDTCISYFRKAKTVEQVNKWLFNCYLVTLKNHMTKTNITFGSKPSILTTDDEYQFLNYEFSFFIKSAEIQLTNKLILNCTNNSFNITSNYNCKNISRLSQYETRSYLSSNFGINLTNLIQNSTNTSTAFNYLMFQNLNLDNAVVINIMDIDNDVSRLSSLIFNSYIIKSENYGQDLQHIYQTDTQKKGIELVSNYFNNSDIDYGIFGNDTISMNVITYFWSQLSNSNFLGIVVFKYNLLDDNIVETKCSNYAVKVIDLTTQNFSFYEIFSILSAFGILTCVFIKYYFLQNILKMLYSNIFFILFVIFLFLEYIYKIKLLLSSLLSYQSLEKIQIDNYELTIFSIENLKIVKSIGILSLSVHMILYLI